MSDETIPCDECGGEMERVIHQKRGPATEASKYHCDDCGAVRTE
jgi:uncharacterized Zn finger protein